LYIDSRKKKLVNLQSSSSSILRQAGWATGEKKASTEIGNNRSNTMKHVLILLTAAIIFPFLLIASELPLGDSQEPQSAITTAGGTEITFEAETATLSGPMQISPDGEAFGNLCINGYHVNRRGWATFEVMIPKDANYVIWGRVRGRDEVTNSFFVRVDGSADMIWEIHKENVWDWDRVSSRGTGNITNPQIDPVIFHFTVGKHIIVIGNREKETRLDRLVITNDLVKTYNDAPNSTLTLDAPGMGNVIPPGSTFEIKWTGKNMSTKVNIDLSFDFGANFNIPVVHNTDNDGSYLWNVPTTINRPKVIMRISDVAGKPYDQHRGYFSIVAPNKVSLSLISPNGGETIKANSIFLIKWKEYAFNGIVEILLSTDNGATWTQIAENQNSAGEDEWNVPNVVSNTCLIKVRDIKDGQPWDVSNSTFRIVPPTELGGHAASDAISLSALPSEFCLTPNFPNPFNPQTSITYGVPEDGNITLAVFDIRGRQVAVLAEGFSQAGWHQATWNAAEFPSGVYTAVLQSGASRAMQRMTLVK
jgi:hypothetical protein